MSTQPLVTRRPSGLPAWPMILLAGVEKAGKTYQAALASASSMVGRTFWLTYGEDDPDEYGALPGVRFEIVQHDGSYRDLLRVIDLCVAQEQVDGKPNLIVLDSATRLWDVLCETAQLTANKRAAAKAKRQGRTPSEDDVQITMDLWNEAKQRWFHVIDALRDHEGPVIVTARLEVVTVVDGNGQPTKEKQNKVKAEKSLPYDVGAIVELWSPEHAYLTGVRSLRVKAAGEKRERFPDFTVEGLWRALGLDGEVGVRSHAGIDAAAAVTGRRSLPRKTLDDWARRILAAEDEETLRALWAETGGAHDVPSAEGFPTIGELIQEQVAAVRAANPQPEGASA